ncbi:hypothetical protein ABPG74_002001 [Tetrahymena malaccensis]
MNSADQNKKVQEGLLSYFKNRISVRNMYQDKGITTLGKAQDITIDEDESKRIKDLQIQIQQLNQTIFLLNKQKSDLEEKLETNQKNQKNDQIFQNQDQQSYQVYPNLNAQNMIQQKPSPNLISNNNAQELINKPQVNNQSQGKIQQQQNSLQKPQQCVKKILLQLVKYMHMNFKMFRMQKFQ